MKLTATTLLVLFIAGSSMAQCKWKIEEEDEFAGNKHLLSKKVTIDGDNEFGEKKFFAYFFMELENGDSKCKVEYIEYTLIDKTVNDFVLRIKATNGDLIEVPASGDALLEYNPTPYTKITVVFEFEEEQLKSMSQGISLIGLNYSGASKKFEQQEKDLTSLAEYATCIHNTLELENSKVKD